ncbi:MAG: DUF4012 domain-containing protein [Propionicimonas sp.]
MARRNRRPVRWILLAAFVAGLSAAGLWGYQRAIKFETLTIAGRVSATSALQNLRDGDPETAVRSLRAARSQFLTARSLLGPDWVRQVPWFGRQVAVADDLCTVGVEATTAGVEVARLLDQAAKVSDDGRLNKLLRLAPTHLDPALASMVKVADLAEQLDPEGLVPQLADAVTGVHRALARAGPLLGRGRALLGLERELFSRQHRFLVITQNSAELRPSGGVMETYGIAEFGPEGFALTRHEDVHSLPNDTLGLPPPAGKPTGEKHLGFRDANWWMDFPTSAAQMLPLWRDVGRTDIDGIIAVDIPMIQNLLAVYGPLRIPEVKVPLTAGNVVEQLTAVVQDEHSIGNRARRPNPVLSLANQLVNQVADLTGEQVLPTLDALGRAADQKHLQIYLLDPQAQADMVTVGWSGAIDPPDGSTDLVAVSNAVVTPTKANLGVSKSIDYRVQLEPDGSARSTLTLGYRKSRLTVKGLAEETLSDYVRAHKLPGARMEPAAKTTFSSLGDPTGLATFAHSFELRRGSTKMVLSTTVPQALRPASPERDGPDWHYRLLVAKQADLVDTDATTSVTVPAGWRVTGSSAWFRVTGKPVATSASDTTVTLSTALVEDLVLDVALSHA